MFVGLLEILGGTDRRIKVLWQAGCKLGTELARNGDPLEVATNVEVLGFALHVVADTERQPSHTVIQERVIVGLAGVERRLRASLAGVCLYVSRFELVFAARNRLD